MKPVITFGEVMMRLAPPNYLRFFQTNSFDVTFCGAEANVSASLARFGIPSDFITRLPKNDLADACIGFLEKHNIGTKYILRGGERLGVLFYEYGSSQRASKVIYDRANSAIATVEPGMFAWHEIFSNASWFHFSGITPALSQGCANACLEAVQIAYSLGITISCDMNYRANLWRWGRTAHEIMPELISKSSILVGNEEDAEKVLGIHPSGVDVTKGQVSATDYYEAFAEISNRFSNLEIIVFTLRGSRSASNNSWSAVIWNRGKIFTAPTYEITPIVDRVGAGDSFMAGLIYGITTYSNLQDALCFATAASCLKHTIVGDFNVVSIEEVKKLMSGDISGRVVR